VLVPLQLSHLGAGAIAIGCALVAAGALEATVSPFSGRLADRRGRHYALSISLATSALGAALLPWPNEAVLLGVVAVLASAAFGLAWACTHTSSPAHLRSRGAGGRVTAL
jgi:MFS family permease